MANKYGRKKMPEPTWLEEAIEWKATPQDLRQPKSARELYTKFGVKENHFYYQMQKPSVQKRILDKCLYMARDRAPDVFKKLEDNAVKGNNRSIELYLKFIMELAEKINNDWTSGGEPIDSVTVNIRDYGNKRK